MDVNNVIVDSYATVGKNLMLVSVFPSYNYDNGTRTDTINGYKYEIVMPERMYEKLSVRIPGEQKLEISENESPQVFLDGLTISVYWTKQGHKVSAVAENIRLVNPPKKTG